MSRIGRLPIDVPAGVTVSVDGLFPMNAEWRARYEQATGTGAERK